MSWYKQQEHDACTFDTFEICKELVVMGIYCVDTLVTSQIA